VSIPTIDPTTQLVDAPRVPWADFGGGIEVKMLRVGGASGIYTILTRFQPGVQLMTHRHFGAVWALTVEGRWRYLEYPWHAEAGSFVFEPPGSVHTLKVPDDNDGPTTIFFTIEAGMVFLGEAGELLFIEDGPSLHQHYSNALAAAGVAYPDEILA